MSTSRETRERLRAETTELQQRLRSDPSIPQVLWDLLDVMVRRLDRIELGEFTNQDEIPTEPAKRLSGALQSVREETPSPVPPDMPVGSAVKRIFDKAREKNDSKK